MSRTDVAVAPPAAPGLRDDLRRLAPVLAALMAGLALAELDATMLATALPTVVGDLGGSDQLLWATTAYLVTGTVMMPVLGRLGDLLGRRPVFLAALSVLVAGSVLGGLARDLPTLVAARAVQGLGGGALVVLVYAVLADLLPARRRAPVMTAVGAVFAGCAVAGPLLGGWLAELAALGQPSSSVGRPPASAGRTVDPSRPYAWGGRTSRIRPPGRLEPGLALGRSTGRDMLGRNADPGHVSTPRTSQGRALLTGWRSPCGRTDRPVETCSGGTRIPGMSRPLDVRSGPRRITRW